MSTATTKTTTRTIVLGKFNFCTEMPLLMNYIADEQWQSTERMKDLEGQQRTKALSELKFMSTSRNLYSRVNVSSNW